MIQPLPASRASVVPPASRVSSPCAAGASAGLEFIFEFVELHVGLHRAVDARAPQRGVHEVGRDDVKLELLAARQFGQARQARDKEQSARRSTSPRITLATTRRRLSCWSQRKLNSAPCAPELGAPVRRVERRNDREQIRIVTGVQRRLIADAGNQLSLVHEIDVTAQRRRAPCIVADAHCLVCRRRGGHPHPAERLRPIDARGSSIGKPTPQVGSRDHQLGHQQIERRARVRGFSPTRGFALAIEPNEMSTRPSGSGRPRAASRSASSLRAKRHSSVSSAAKVRKTRCRRSSIR